ncbi:F187B protein, partial [Polyodon spathula]|nr:F187B protein [Polyodon spathula]
MAFIDAKGPVKDLEQKPALRRLASMAKLIEDDLKLKEPLVSDLGAFLCQEGDKVLAYYEIDFQDVLKLHVCYADLGQETLGNATVDLGGGKHVEIYTRWSEWQACDRCGSLGERKRVGFCYARMLAGSTEVKPPLPCGLMKLKLEEMGKLMKRGPELRIESCMVECMKEQDLRKNKETPILLLDTYLTRLHEPVELKCPRASIYNPVCWQKDDNHTTRLGLLKANGRHSLDNQTGGAVYWISHAFPDDAGLYRCYANQSMTGVFTVEFHALKPIDPREVRRGYRVIKYLLVALAVFLLVFTVKKFSKDSSIKKPYRRVRPRLAEAVLSEVNLGKDVPFQQLPPASTTEEPLVRGD